MSFGLQAAEATAGAHPGPESQDYRSRLVDTAYQAVSKMPTDPHIRNRSRAQERMVTACLEMDKPERAAQYAAGISNWRRGAAFADIALYYATRGDKEAARKALDKAEQLVANSEAVLSGEVIPSGEFKELAESLGEWRLDRVKAHIARAYIVLNQMEMAAKWSDHISQDEVPKMTASEASVCTDENYETVRDSLYALAESEQFEAVKNALSGLCDLYDRFYTDPDKRNELSSAIDRYRAAMPQFMQIEVLTRMAGAAMDNGDKDAGLSLARQADAALEDASFRPRLYFPMKASIITLLFQGGDTETALDQLDVMVQLYDARRDSIIDIYRTAVLCRIAETGVETGRTDAARELYRRAAKEAVVNSNSRPRADDLSEICRSMAVHNLEPSADLFRSLETINDNLGDPW